MKNKVATGFLIANSILAVLMLGFAMVDLWIDKNRVAFVTDYALMVLNASSAWGNFHLLKRQDQP